MINIYDINYQRYVKITQPREGVSIDTILLHTAGLAIVIMVTITDYELPVYSGIRDKTQDNTLLYPLGILMSCGLDP